MKFVFYGEVSYVSLLTAPLLWVEHHSLRIVTPSLKSFHTSNSAFFSPPTLENHRHAGPSTQIPPSQISLYLTTPFSIPLSFRSRKARSTYLPSLPNLISASPNTTSHAFIRFLAFKIKQAVTGDAVIRNSGNPANIEYIQPNRRDRAHHRELRRGRQREEGLLDPDADADACTAQLLLGAEPERKGARVSEQPLVFRSICAMD
jgi:hypothetical protein